MQGSGGNKGLAAQALHKATSGSLVRTPSFTRSTTPRAAASRAPVPAPIPATASKLGASAGNSSPRVLPAPRAVWKTGQARNSLSGQAPAVSPCRSRPTFEPVRRSASRSTTPRSRPSAPSAPAKPAVASVPQIQQSHFTHPFVGSRLLTLFARHLNDCSLRTALFHWRSNVDEARTRHRMFKQRMLAMSFGGRLNDQYQRQLLLQVLGNWSRESCRERWTRAERQFATQRTDMQSLSAEVEELRKRLKLAEMSIMEANLSREKCMQTKSLAKKEDAKVCQQTATWRALRLRSKDLQTEAESEADATTEAEAESEPLPADFVSEQGSVTSFSLRPHADDLFPSADSIQHALPVKKRNSSDLQSFVPRRGEALEDRVEAMIAEQHRDPISLARPKTSLNGPKGIEFQDSHDFVSRSSAAPAFAPDVPEQQQPPRPESTQETSSMMVGAFPGRALLRRLAGPKPSGRRRRGLLDSSSDSDG